MLQRLSASFFADISRGKSKRKTAACAPYMFAKDVAKTISAKINCAHSFAKYFAKVYLRKMFYEKIRADHFCEHCFRKIFCAKRKTAVKMEKAENR